MNPATQMNQDGVIVKDFRDLDGWRQARSVVCALLDVSATLSRSAEHGSYAHSLNSLAVAVLDNMAKGYEGDRKSFSEAQLVISRLDELLTQGKTSGLLKVSVFIPLRRELDLVRQSLEEPPPEF